MPYDYFHFLWSPLIDIPKNDTNNNIGFLPVVVLIGVDCVDKAVPDEADVVTTAPGVSRGAP